MNRQRTKPVFTRLSIALFAFLAALPGAASAQLSADTDVANAGYFQLTWQADEPIALSEATTADFADARTIYTGADSGYTVSGKSNGTYFYRIAAADGVRELAPPVRVVVEHHSLQRAGGFFALGGVVFVATLGLILFAGRQQP